MSVDAAVLKSLEAPKEPTALLRVVVSFLAGDEAQKGLAELETEIAQYALSVVEPLRAATDENAFERLFDATATGETVGRLHKFYKHRAFGKLIQKAKVARLRPQDLTGGKPIREEAKELVEDLTDLSELARDFLTRAERSPKRGKGVVEELVRNGARFEVVVLALAHATLDGRWSREQIGWLWVEGRKAMTAIFMLAGGTIDEVSLLQTSRDKKLSGVDESAAGKRVLARLGL